MQPDMFVDEAMTPASVLATLQQHRGAQNGLTARELCQRVTGKRGPGIERAMRSVVEALRTAGHRICATPTHGYFMAETPAELDYTCLFLYARSMTGLRQIAAMRRVALPDLAGQLRLPIGANDDPATTNPNPSLAGTDGGSDG